VHGNGCATPADNIGQQIARLTGKVCPGHFSLGVILPRTLRFLKRPPQLWFAVMGRCVQALANMGMSEQQAHKLAGHADLGAHERYLRNSAATLEIPEAALPRLLSWQNLLQGFCLESKSSMFLGANSWI